MINQEKDYQKFVLFQIKFGDSDDFI